MYRGFFGLNDLPFKSTPNVNTFFGEASRQAIFEALLYTINRGDGIVKVTGEVGCGKTMILRMLAEHLGDDVVIVYINAPNFSPKDMLFFICNELQIPVDFNLPKISIINALKEKLISLHSTSKKAVLLIDEAQTIPIDTLEELRLLSNLETNDDKLLQMVLFGQPELDKALEKPEIRQLKSRITYSIDLPKFSIDEVQSYLNYRLRAVGYRGLDIFNKSMAKKIHAISDGYPRAINEVADKLLMAMYGEGDRTAKSKHFRALNLEGQTGKLFSYEPFRIGLVFFTLIVFVGMTFSAYIYYRDLKIALDTTGLDSMNSTVSKVVSVNVETNKKKPEDMVTGQNEATAVRDEEELLETGLFGKDRESDKLSQVVEIQVEKETASVSETVVKTNSLNDSVEGLLKKVIPYHMHGIKLLSKQPAEYNIIQLSTIRLSDFEKQAKAYKLDATVQDRFIVLIDFDEVQKRYRVKIFLKEFGGYRFLANELKKLSPEAKMSNPYILPLKTILKSANSIELP